MLSVMSAESSTASSVDLVSSADAASLLGVQRSTLYAYVSRGQLTSHRRPGQRGSWFDPRELDGLAREGRRGSLRPDVVIESGLTLVTPAGHHYRGRSAIELAASATFEEVADLLWGPADRGATPWPDASTTEVDSVLHQVLDALPASASPLDAVRVVLPVLAARDTLRGDLRRDRVLGLARRLVDVTAAMLWRHAGAPAPGDRRAQLVTEHGIAGRLATVLSDDPSNVSSLEADHVRRVLVLMADHELAASTSAVRIAASFGADPYAALIAGHAAFGGALHGAASTWVERFLDELLEVGDAERVVGEWLSGGRRIPGLGQVLYPDGDPRGAVLLAAAAETGATDVVDMANSVEELVRREGLPPPNVDFGLAVLARCHAWRRGSGELLFAVGRSTGWLAHAMEEYEQRSSVRLRALYTGPRPEV